MADNERVPLLEQYERRLSGIGSLLDQYERRFSKQPSPERVAVIFQKKHTGASNETQTIINLINVSIGVSMLSLPIALKYAGWAAGACLWVFSGVLTRYATMRLTRCMESDRSLKTYVDVANASFGVQGMFVTSILFSFNMIAACVAFVTLFADTMAIIVPSVSVVGWKMVCGLMVLPMQFVSFRVLAPISVIGVVACIGIAVMVISAGLVNPTGPGSLRDPVETSLRPQSFLTLCASIGLLMAPFGAVPNYPTLYRDMKEPTTFDRCLNLSFVITVLLYTSVGVCGYLMFGVDTVQEISSNILDSPEGVYPTVLSAWFIGMTAAMPVTKITLSSRPLMVLIENTFLGPDPTEESDEPTDPLYQEGDIFLPREPLKISDTLTTSLLRIVIRFSVIALIVIISALVPAFDRVVALMGAGLCYAISAILPLLFHLKLLSDDMNRFQKVFDCILVAISFVLAILGTGAVILS